LNWHAIAEWYRGLSDAQSLLLFILGATTYWFLKKTWGQPEEEAVMDSKAYVHQFMGPNGVQTRGFKATRIESEAETGLVFIYGEDEDEDEITIGIIKLGPGDSVYLDTLST
jgi:hypothetical protein